MNRLVLFLCTGNYYRSRFAECLFNYRASQTSLSWRAFSRGTEAESGISNIGPISIYAVRGLRRFGVELEPEPRFPMQLEEEDLARAGLIVALNQAEHLPFLESRFPDWADLVEYWDIPDLDLLPAEEAWARMAGAVQALMRRLGSTKIIV